MTAPASSAPSAERPLRTRLRILAILLASSLTVMAGAVMSPSIPAIADHFGGSDRVAFLARFVLTVPSLFIALSAPLAGYIADRFGRLRLLFAALALYAAGGTTGLYLDSLMGILAGRAVLGISVGAIMTVATALISDYFDPRLRQRVFGWQAAFMAYGAGVFLLVGGGLAELHWRGPFGVYLAALAFLVLFRYCLDEPPAGPRRRGPGSDPVGLRSYRGLLPFAAILYTMVVTFSIAFYFMPVQLPFRLQALGYARPLIFASALLIMTLCAGTASTFFDRYKPYFRYPRLAALGFAGMAAGFVLIAAAPGYPVAVLGAAVAGTGLGVIQPTSVLWIMDRAPSPVRGRLAGGVTTAIFFGHFLSPLVSQPLANALGLGGAFGAMAAILAVLAAVLALFGPRIPSPAGA